MWKESVNRVLRRLTGHQLEQASAHAERVRETERLRGRLRTAEERQRTARDEAARAQRQVRKTTQKLEKSRSRTQAVREQLEELKQQRHAVPHHVDEPAARILEQVRERTMTDHAKLYGLIEATRYVVRHSVPGAIVECGVWRGGSMQAVALALLQAGVADRELHLYDTFEGMPPPSDKDRREDVTAEEMLATHDKDHRVWAIAELPDVEEAMREVEYPPDLVHFHQGMVEDTVPAEAPKQIALLRLDTDWYESTKHELEHLYDRLAPGGVLILDDYGDWEGARDATDEFLSARKEPLLLVPLGTGRLAVKPWR